MGWIEGFAEGVDWSFVHDVESDEAGEGEGLFDGFLCCLSHSEEDVADQGDEELCAHAVFGGCEEVADLEVLLDPFEEQLDLPALFVEFCDVFGGGVEIVGQDPDLLAGGEAHDDLAHRV